MTMAVTGRAMPLPSRAVLSRHKKWFLIWRDIEILAVLESSGRSVKVRLERVLDAIRSLGLYTPENFV